METSSDTLWIRLGGETELRKIIDAFVTLVVRNPKVNYSRTGAFKLDEEAIAKTKKGAFEFLSSATGGPYSYAGDPLELIHTGMGITDEEFDAFNSDFKTALELNGVLPAVIQEAIEAVSATRPFIVGK